MRALLLVFVCCVLSACCPPGAALQAQTTAFTAEVIAVAASQLQVRLETSTVIVLEYTSSDIRVGDNIYVVGTLENNRINITDLRVL